MHSLENMNFLVTGATSGIGKATALALASSGASVAVTGRDGDRLEKVRTACESYGNPVYSVKADLVCSDSILELMQTVVEQLGKLDGFVHCAGVSCLEPIRFQTDATIDKTLEINVKAAFRLLAAFRKPSIRKKKSSVVMISSVMGQVGQPAISAYCASKGALEAAVRAWAVELARENIRVNAIAPGYIEGQMFDEHSNMLSKEQVNNIISRHPLGLGKAEFVANAIEFLLSSKSEWITGVSIPVDGGYLAS